MLEVLLVRHMETSWNEQAKFIGRTDIGLSAAGLVNAERLALSLNGESFDRICSSGLRRSIQTAEALVAGCGADVTIHPGLNEIDFGAWEGKTYAEIVESGSGEIEAWMENPEAVDIPSGEPWATFVGRVTGAWREITQGATGRLAVVCHGGVIKVILGQALGVPATEYWQIYQDKGATNRLMYEGRWEVLQLNDTRYRSTSPPAGGDRPIAETGE